MQSKTTEYPAVHSLEAESSVSGLCFLLQNANQVTVLTAVQSTNQIGWTLTASTNSLLPHCLHSELQIKLRSISDYFKTGEIYNVANSSGKMCMP